MLVGSQTSLSGGVLIAVVVLGLIEVGLMVFCIVDLMRRPYVLGGRQWVWAIVIVVFGVIGPIIYLAIGRVPPPVKEPEASPATHRVTAAADLLYGPQAGQPEVAQRPPAGAPDSAPQGPVDETPAADERR
jgi:hypothetical protein